MSIVIKTAPLKLVKKILELTFIVSEQFLVGGDCNG
jgi:hypothetical protein